jgi:hypothetical protein
VNVTGASANPVAASPSRYSARASAPALPLGENCRASLLRDQGHGLLAMTVTSTSMPATRSARTVVRTGLAEPGNAPS